MSARTVIGPDPTLKIDEVVVPKEIAQSLTFPDFVNKHNIDRLTKLVNSGNAIRLVKKNESGQEIKINLAAAINNHGTPLQHDDIIKRPKITNNHEEKHNFDTFETIVIKDPKNFVLKEGDILFRNNFQQKVVLPSKKFIKLEEGWIVHRYLQDGDILVLNRQPTLHKASMMALRVKIMDVKTFKFNLACTKPYNADFDGDEMNAHSASIRRKVKLSYLHYLHQNKVLCLVNLESLI